MRPNVSESPSPPLPPGATLGHYRILSEINRGGMGVVYRARDCRLRRDVALKIPPPSFVDDAARRARFTREAQSAAALNHPNVATIYETGETNSIVYLTMELIEGESLKELLSRGPLTVERSLSIACEIADGLAAAHGKGVVHRDLKPANVMLTQTGRVKIVDFGLAKRVFERGESGSDDSTLDRDLTSAGHVVGTLSYMSPEQLLGAPVDARSDTFSLAVIVYEMLTGGLPFQGGSPSERLHALLTKPPTPLRTLRDDVPDALDEAIRTALARDPEARFRTISEFQETLQSARSENTKRGRSPAPSRPPQERPRRSRPRFALGAVAAAVVATALLRLPVSLPTDVPGSKHVVILPFETLDEDAQPERRAFGDGVAETISSKLTQLSGGEGTWVVPFSETRAAEVASVVDARRAFGVDLVVTGSFQLESNRARLTLNLVDAETLRQMDSAVLDRGRDRVFELQDEAAIRLARMLRLGLESGVLGGSSSRAVEADAQELFLTGRGYLLRYDKPGNVDAAVDAFRRALGVDPSFVEARASLGEAYWRLYEETRAPIHLDRALEESEAAIELDDRSAAAHTTLGLIQTGRGRYDVAIESFRSALRLEPRQAGALQGLADAYEAAGDIEQAEVVYRESIRQRPDYWAAYNRFGVFYYLLGRYEEAARQFSKVTELTPDNPRGYTNLGGAYFQLGRIDEAGAMFQRALEAEPSYDAYANLGTIRFAQGDYADSAALFEKALALDASDFQVVLNLASALRWAGDREGARRQYERAAEMIEVRLAVNAKDPNLLVSLGLVRASTGRAVEAAPLVEKGLALAPEQVELQVTAAEAYEALGRRREAVELVRKALAMGYSKASIERNPTFRQMLLDPRYLTILNGSEIGGE